MAKRVNRQDLVEFYKYLGQNNSEHLEKLERNLAKIESILLFNGNPTFTEKDLINQLALKYDNGGSIEVRSWFKQRLAPAKIGSLESALDHKAPETVGDSSGTKLLSADEAIKKNCVSAWLWLFTIPFFRMCMTKKNGLSLADVPKCPAADNAREQASRMKKLLAKHSPVNAYMWFVFPEFKKAFCFTLLTLVLMFFQIKTVQFVIQALQDIEDAGDDNDAIDAALSRGYMWAILMGASPIFSSIFLQQAMMLGYTAGRRAYAAYTSLLFEKPALVTAGALSQLEEGVKSSHTKTIQSYGTYDFFCFI